MRNQALIAARAGLAAFGCALTLGGCAVFGVASLDPSASAESSTPSTGAAPAWREVWADEFVGDELDRTRWSPERSCWGGGNNERQCYVDSPANIRVQDGVLSLIAQPEAHTGPLYPVDGARAGAETATRDYTSGKLRTAGLDSWRYGRFSARMKLPPGQGVWPAFWMMPADGVYGDWPLSGELDIMEAVNLGTPCAECDGGEDHRTSAALHFGGAQPDNTYLFAHADGARRPGPASEWRVYSVEWAEGVIQWFVDGEMFFRLESDDWFTESPRALGRAHAPFDQSFYLILNLAAGGNLPELSNGGGFDPGAFPAELLVDWVRVEQCAGDEETGRACLAQNTWTGTPLGPWEVQAR